MTNTLNLGPLYYGVYDDTLLSFSGVYTADTAFETLAEAFTYIGEQFETVNEGDDFRFSIYPSYYDKRRDTWLPVPDASPIEIDGRYFIPIEDGCPED